MPFTVPTDFSNTNTSYEPIPADNHIGVCIGVIDLGTHQESYQGGPAKSVRKVKLQFELPGVTRDDGKAGIISATFNYSMHEKATFRKLLDGWLGGDWPERYRGRSWDFLLGVPAMVNVENGPGKREPGRTVSWVASVSKFPKGLPAPQHTRDTFWLDLSEKSLPENLSVWDAQKVRESAEYKAGGFTDLAPRPDANGNAPARAIGRPAPAAQPGPSVQCPRHLAPVLARLGMPWPFDLPDIPDQASEDEISLLSPHACPF